MRDESNPTLRDRNGQVVVRPTAANLDNCGTLELYDSDGMRIPAIEIPDEVYFPEPDEGSLAVENAALRRLLTSIKRTIAAANCDFDEGNPIPARLNHALAMLDEDFTHFETLAECPDPDPVLTHAMREAFPGRLPWHVARDNGLL